MSLEHGPSSSDIVPRSEQEREAIRARNAEIDRVLNTLVYGYCGARTLSEAVWQFLNNATEYVSVDVREANLIRTVQLDLPAALAAEVAQRVKFHKEKPGYWNR